MGHHGSLWLILLAHSAPIVLSGNINEYQDNFLLIISLFFQDNIKCEDNNFEEHKNE